MSFYLIAQSSLAKTFQGPFGPDIQITANTKIGRNVNTPGCCRLPPKWAQVSGSHCRVYHDKEKDPSGYWIEDTSTNGTLVNGERITKGSSVPLKEGDVVQLSWNAAGDAAALLEYVFQKEEGPGKRSRSASAAAESPEGKRNRNSNDSDALLKSVANLEQSNQELRKKLDVERSQKEQVERCLQTVRDEVAEAMEAAKRDATAAQQQAQATAEKEAETAGAALQAAQAAATANESRAVEAEEQLAETSAGLEAAEAKLAALQEAYNTVHENEGKLTKEVEALKEQVETLESSAATAAQRAASLEGKLAEAAETNQAHEEAFIKQKEELQEALSDTVSARSTAEQAAAAAASAQATEQAAVTARQAADAEAARLQSLLEEAQRAQERAQEQQHNAEEQLSVKQALLTSMAQRFAQVEEGKRRAAQLHAQASKKIAEADNALHALGQELMYAAEGRLQSNSGPRTAIQGEHSHGGATEGAAGRGEEDADATAILAMHNEVTQQEAPAPVQQSPTLSLQLNRGNTQHTVAEQPLEETQENEADAPEAGRADRAGSTASQETPASPTPSAGSSSRGFEGNENVNNNSMDYDNASSKQIGRKSGVSAATQKVQPTEAKAVEPTMIENASLAFQLPDHTPSGGMDGHNTVDEFDGMA